MKGNSRRVLVIDVEATCWNTTEEAKGQWSRSEVIEIGAALLNTHTLQIEESFDWFVWPILTDISPFCTELTGITEEKLRTEGKSLDYLHRQLGTWALDMWNCAIWASWGQYDKTMLDKMFKDFEHSPLPGAHQDIKMLESMLEGRKSGIGLGKALEQWGLEFVGRPHNGRDDAVNTARLFAKMIARGRS